MCSSDAAAIARKGAYRSLSQTRANACQTKKLAKKCRKNASVNGARKGIRFPWIDQAHDRHVRQHRKQRQLAQPVRQPQGIDGSIASRSNSRSPQRRRPFAVRASCRSGWTTLSADRVCEATSRRPRPSSRTSLSGTRLRRTNRWHQMKQERSCAVAGYVASLSCISISVRLAVR